MNMMRNKCGIRILSVAALLIALSACTRDCLEDGIYGYLGVSITSFVDMEDLTKSSLPESDYPTYNISLYKGSEQIWKTTYDNFLSDVRYNRVQAGVYTVEVESCTESQAEIGNGRMRMMGKSPVEVRAGRRSEVDIQCEMANARVTLAIAPEFAAEIVNTGASVTDGSRKIAVESIDTQHLLERAFYYNVDDNGKKELVFTVTTGITSIDKVKTFEIPVTVVGGEWNKITLKNKQ